MTTNIELVNYFTPQDLDLPSKYSEWREYQQEAIRFIAQSDKKIILLQAPTGAGKTLIMAGAGKLLNNKVLYTAHTRQLQDQVAGDFPYARTLKGRSNYPCVKFPSDFPFISCDHCTSDAKHRDCVICEFIGAGSDRCVEATQLGKRCPCWFRCTYRHAKLEALDSELCITNMAYFLREANSKGDLSGWPMVFLDEGDLTEGALMNYIELSITKKFLNEIEVEPPHCDDCLEDWITLIREKLMLELKDRIADLEDSCNKDDLRLHKRYMSTLESMQSFLLNCNDSWILECYKGKRWTFRPATISHFATRYLWNHSDKFVIMSATIIDPELFCSDLGLPADSYDFLDLPSTFPAENRLITFSPKANMTFKTKDTAWPEMSRAIDDLLSQHSDIKGLIHTSSYDLCSYIMNNTNLNGRLITHNSSDDRSITLEDFKRSAEPLVLVSPSMERGIDLPYDLCRLNIIAKVPWPNKSNSQVAARLKLPNGNRWYVVQTIRSIVQATGRSNRSKDDFSSSYILDQQFETLYSRYKHLFPGYWREALRFDFEDIF